MNTSMIEVAQSMVGPGSFYRYGAYNKFACSGNASASELLVAQHLNGRNYVITGGSTGIGLSLALNIARVGGTVILAEHNLTRGQEAASRVSSMTGSLVHAVHVDLSNFHSVAAAASKILRFASRIHTIICNAAMTISGFSLKSITPDGFNRMFQTNFLGHALLVQLLVHSVRSVHGELIFMLSGVAYGGCTTSQCLKLENITQAARSPRFTLSSYMLSKFALGFYVSELGRQEPLIKVYAVDPGLVDTDAHTSAAAWERTCRSLKLPGPCPLSPDQGALTPAWLAVSRQAASGKFFYLCTPVISPWDAYALIMGQSRQDFMKEHVYNLANEWIEVSKFSTIPTEPVGHAVLAMGIALLVVCPLLRTRPVALV